MGGGEEVKLCIGLVIKNNDAFVNKWIDSANRTGDIFIIIDNGISKESREKLINHPKTKYYFIQKELERNMSRDYQKILEIAREEDCTWIFNLDSDELVSEFDTNILMSTLLNTKDNSIGFPLFEMRGDDKHYVKVNDMDGTLKDARMCHKCYKVLSHFKFNEKDKHGTSIPHNCSPGQAINIPIQHFGHFSKALREEKRKMYGNESYKDFMEDKNSWLEEDESKITIKKWEDNPLYKK